MLNPSDKAEGESDFVPEKLRALESVAEQWSATIWRKVLTFPSSRGIPRNISFVKAFPVKQICPALQGVATARKI